MSEAKHLTALQLKGLLRKQNPDHLTFIKVGTQSFAAGWPCEFDLGKSIAVDTEPDPSFAPPVDGMIETLEHELSKSQGKRPMWVVHAGKNYKVTGVKKFLSRVTIQTEESK